MYFSHSLLICTQPSKPLDRPSTTSTQRTQSPSDRLPQVLFPGAPRSECLDAFRDRFVSSADLVPSGPTALYPQREGLLLRQIRGRIGSHSTRRFGSPGQAVLRAKISEDLLAETPLRNRLAGMDDQIVERRLCSVPTSLTEAACRSHVKPELAVLQFEPGTGRIVPNRL